jgi:membrane associated rhomboid family serine protease
MNAVEMSPLEAILRHIAAAAPRPWYPRAFARERSVPLESLNFFLEFLWLEGLLQKADAGTAETGAGLALSPAGVALLEDPGRLGRLRRGAALRPGDRGSEVRALLRESSRPWAVRLLLLANLAVFAWGWWLARPNPDVAAAFLRGPSFSGQDPTPRAVQNEVMRIEHHTGAALVEDLYQGQWWRLLTATFVHAGLPHLLMNMLWLFGPMRRTEQLWGAARLLTIYLLAGVGSSVTALAWQKQPTLLLGASGSLCGLLAAEAFWVVRNGRYLPRQQIRRWRSGLLMTAVLLVLVSLFPGVSGLGHLGGAVVGGVVAFLLDCHQFGPAGWRWLGLAGLLALPPAGWLAIDWARHHNPTWLETERRLQHRQLVREDQDFEGRFIRPVNHETAAAWEVYEEQARPLLERHPGRRDRDRLHAALEALDGQQRVLEALAAELGQAGPYRSPEAETARQKARDYAEALAKLLERTTQVLQAEGERGKTDHKGEEEIKAQERRALELRGQWRALLEPG